MGAVAWLSGADAATIVRLAVSMTALQLAIGALNDLVDAPADAGRKPGKPIPAGLMTPGAARLVVLVAALTGVLLAVPSGPWLVALAVVVLAIGGTYDLAAKGTAWSWLPFAVGIPILPVYGWLGATGSLEPWLVALLPIGAMAGAGLAIANAGVDRERDEAAGRASVATALGPDRAWAAGAALLAGALIVASGWLAATGQGTVPVVAGIMVGAALLVAGLGLGRATGPEERERGWQLQAVGVAVVAVAWIAGVTGTTP